jgi:Rrf2 family protein
MMQVSSKVRYASQALILLGIHYPGKAISLKEIARREQISEKYLEGIFAGLRTARLVDSNKGKYGGYRLSRSPETIRLYDIVSVFESGLLLDPDEAESPRAADYDIWREVEDALVEKLSSITLDTMVERARHRKNVLDYHI